MDLSICFGLHPMFFHYTDDDSLRAWVLIGLSPTFSDNFVILFGLLDLHSLCFGAPRSVVVSTDFDIE